MVPYGGENLNAQVDALVERGLLQSEVTCSNSMIAAWWNQLKHSSLFLNDLDSLRKVRSLVQFYVVEHNSRIPHAAFDGQTPDEMCYGRGASVPDDLAGHHEQARRARM